MATQTNTSSIGARNGNLLALLRRLPAKCWQQSGAELALSSLFFSNIRGSEDILENVSLLKWRCFCDSFSANLKLLIEDAGPFANILGSPVRNRRMLGRFLPIEKALDEIPLVPLLGKFWRGDCLLGKHRIIPGRFN